MVAEAYHINSNLYHYAGNNPVKYTDPDGRIVIAISTAIAAKALCATVVTVGVITASKEIAKNISNAVTTAKTDIQKENLTTPIYILGSGSGTNLTPRTPKDSTGLSYSLAKPDNGPYTITSMEAVNGSGVLVAIKDGPNHVSVVPTDMSKMPEWQASREHANENPHTYTKILQSISIKIKDNGNE